MKRASAIVSIVFVSFAFWTTQCFAVYHPGLGRFMQRDTFEYIDGMSLYQYVGSKPIVMTDPTGGCSHLPHQRVGHELKKQLQSRCKPCDCDHVSDCKAEAKKIAGTIQRTIDAHYGRGRNTSEHNRGGYLCWDWANGFDEAHASIGATHISGNLRAARNKESYNLWRDRVRMRDSRAQEGYLVHFYLELTVGHDPGNRACQVAADDGWIVPPAWVGDSDDLDNFYGGWDPIPPTLPRSPPLQPIRPPHR